MMTYWTSLWSFFGIIPISSQPPFCAYRNCCKSNLKLNARLRSSHWKKLKRISRNKRTPQSSFKLCSEEIQAVIRSAWMNSSRPGLCPSFATSNEMYSSFLRLLSVAVSAQCSAIFASKFANLPVYCTSGARDFKCSMWFLHVASVSSGTNTLKRKARFRLYRVVLVPCIFGFQEAALVAAASLFVLERSSR